MSSPCAPEVAPAPSARLCFVHEPLNVFRDASLELLAGTATACRGEEEVRDNGLTEALRDGGCFDAVFAGHDHHSDCVKRLRSRAGRAAEGVLLGYGRCGSFFPPSEHEGRRPLPFRRGARVFEVDFGAAERTVLRTWVAEEGDDERSRRHLVELSREHEPRAVPAPGRLRDADESVCGGVWKR